MKPFYYKKYSRPFDSSFLVQYAEIPHTFDKFHFHKDYEILFNIENSGTRFIGDSIQRFNNGDLVIVGPHIPHYWHSDDKYFEGLDDLMAKVILIQFEKTFLGDKFFSIPEMKKIDEFLAKTSYGVRFRGRDAAKIGEKIIQISDEEGWRRLVLMIEMLCMMSEATEAQLLSSRAYTEAFKYSDQKKMTELFNFMVQNHNREISLDEISKYAAMNKTAFCRYFKKSTSKTFSDALNEIRISFACKQLINTDKTVSEIAFECGFNNISYFNRLFQRIKKVTPLVYRKNHLRKES